MRMQESYNSKRISRTSLRGNLQAILKIDGGGMEGFLDRCIYRIEDMIRVGKKHLRFPLRLSNLSTRTLSVEATSKVTRHAAQNREIVVNQDAEVKEIDRLLDIKLGRRKWKLPYLRRSLGRERDRCQLKVGTFQLGASTHDIFGIPADKFCQR